MRFGRFLAAAITAFGLQTGAAAAAGENVTGRWSGLISLPLVPSSGASLKNGKVLLWSADGEFSFEANGTVQSTLFDPITGQNVRQTASVGHNMFCTGTTMLENGRLLVNGGSNSSVTSLYDPADRSFRRVQDMNIPRGYTGNTILPDGSVFTLGGSWSGDVNQRKDGEIWTPSAGWRRLPGVTPEGMTSTYPSEANWARDNQFALVPTGNGRVLYAAPGPMMKWIDTSGSGAVADAGRRGDDAFAAMANVVMYDAGKLFKNGGSVSFGGTAASAAAYRIDVTTGAAVVAKQAAMIYPRIFHNSVVLPNGSVMMVGGQTFGQGFSDSNSVLETEIWNPATGSFSAAAAPIAVGRNYHSIALLLPDARVLSGGGGLCGGGCSANHPDVQLYSPGYLFDAAGAPASRPSIVSAPDELGFGRPISVTTDRAVASFALVRMGATTHTVNADQRRLALRHEALGGTSYRIAVPSNAGLLLPGYWMLFALDATGTPSVAKIVHVAPNGVASMVAPEPPASRVGAAVSIRPNVVPLAPGVRFSAIGLPGGLTVDGATGAISGAPTAAGSFSATLIATLGDQSVSTDFMVAVDPPPSQGDGLLGEYFGGPNLVGAPVASRREALDFAFGDGGGPGGGAPNVFAARWSGTLVAARGGPTRFRIEADDGVRLWIDGKPLADDWTSHGVTAYEGALDLAAGGRYPIFVEYYNGGGAGALRLSWLRPGDSGFTAIPRSELFAGAPSSTTNVALRKPAAQSSVYENGVASRAVDGVVDGQWANGSVTHTQGEDAPWWQVDLQAQAAIDYVRLWKRTDCCAERLQNVVLFVAASDMTGRSFANLMADPAIAKRPIGGSAFADFIDVPAQTSGRFVRVQAGGPHILQIAEAEVFARSVNRPPTIAAAAAQTAAKGQAVALRVTASDPDGDALRFSASGLPGGLAIDAGTGAISGVLTASGAFASTVTVADAAGASASAAIRWTVTDGAPKIMGVAVLPAVVAATVRYQPEILNGAGATFSWRFGDGSALTAFATASAVSHVFTAAGVFDVTLTLQGPDGTRSTYSFDQAVYVRAPADKRGGASGGAGYETCPGAAPRLWIANSDNDSVAVLDLGTNRLTGEVTVGMSPQGVAIAPSGKVWVANRDSATISVIDPATLKVVRTIALPAASQPFGLAFANGAAVVTLEALGEAAVVYEDGTYGGSAPVGASPRHFAVNAAQDRVYVSRFVTGPQPGEATAAVKSVDAAGRPTGGEVRVVRLDGVVERTIVLKQSARTDSEVGGRGVPNYVGAVALSPDGKSAWAPSKQDNIARGSLRDGRPLDFQNTVRAIVSRIDLETGQEDPAARVDLDNSGVASAAVMHPTGAWLFVALQSSRQVAVVDPVGRRELFRFAVGRAPSSLSLSPDGNTLYVVNAMDRTVTVADVSPMVARGQKQVRIVATVATVTREALAVDVLRGKQLFYDAADPRLARDGYLSCAVCHDRGETDGRTWDLTGQGEGLRNTISLVGRAGMGEGFLHWSGNFNEVQDFEGQIRSLAGGSGLMTDAAFAARSQPLGAAKAGASADLDALAAYVSSLKTFPASPFAAANGGLVGAGVQGKAVFDRAGCAACHGGAALTISGDASRLKNVGTIKRSSGKRLGGPLTGLDVPTLRGVWATPPYLHDGSAATLQDAVRAHSGVTVPAADLNALADYLRQIGRS